MSTELTPIRPLFTAEEAEQAVLARRAGRMDDPQLVKLGALLEDVEADVRRILLQSPRVAEYINLTPGWIKAQREDDQAAQDRVLGKLDDLWFSMSQEEIALIESLPLSRFNDDPTLSPAELLKPDPVVGSPTVRSSEKAF